MATKYVVTGDQYRAIDGKMSEIKRQLNQNKGSPLGPEKTADALQLIVEGKLGVELPVFLSPVQQFQSFLHYNKWLKEYAQEFVISNDEIESQWAKLLATPEDALLFYCHMGHVVKTAELAWEYACSYRDKIWKSDFVKFDEQGGYMKPADNEPDRPSGFYIMKRPPEDELFIGKKFQNTQVVDVRKQLGNDWGIGCEGIQFVGVTHRHYPELMDGDKIPFIDLPGLAISPSADGGFDYAPNLGFGGGGLRLNDWRAGRRDPYYGSGSLQQC